jgi:transcriptional regulator with XRE-family HTH domain
MDKRKIGQFIAQCRRYQHITQEQLAEMLNVTDKSVSKWENGHSLPAADLYPGLCAILGVSINELFAGQRIKENEYKSIADQNLMQMIKYKMYCMSDKKITFQEFDSALTEIAELTTELKSFAAKEDAVQHMVKETDCSYETCSRAYDFYLHLFTIPEQQEEAK